MARARGRPAAYHHGDLRRALLAEATAVLAREGAASLSLRALARRLGVSPAAPYAHFPDKAALLAALAEQGFRSMLADLRRAFRREPSDARGRLRSMLVAYVLFAQEHPAHFEIMFGPERPAIEQHPGLHGAAHEATGVMLTAVRDCQREGVVEPGDPMSSALFAWVVVHGLSLLVRSGMMPLLPDRKPSRTKMVEVAESFVERALAALAPRRGPSQRSAH